MKKKNTLDGSLEQHKKFFHQSQISLKQTDSKIQTYREQLDDEKNLVSRLWHLSKSKLKDRLNLDQKLSDDIPDKLIIDGILAKLEGLIRLRKDEKEENEFKVHPMANSPRARQ